MRTLLVAVFCMLLVSSIGLLSGCKSEGQVKAEQNIRAYIAQQGQGSITVTKISHVGDEQDYDGMIRSTYDVTLRPADGRQLTTMVRFITDQQSGEIIDMIE
ncbi:MAG: hypothetical protein BWY76_02427 [bacterium ADurb.Bin429]|nr:MAG: hypothetical protein BWY76_02427 [bacterium ADurb.Bin429]